MRYLITVSYDGTEFSGYQKQPKMRTVQGEIEKALKEISGGKKIDIHERIIKKMEPAWRWERNFCEKIDFYCVFDM